MHRLTYHLIANYHGPQDALQLTLKLSLSLSNNGLNPYLNFRMEALSIANSIEAYEPHTLKEAISSEEAELWRVALEDEYKTLMDNNTWNLVQRPADRNFIKSKWVFKMKSSYEGVNERFEARIVAKGFTQVFGIDYRETFAPEVFALAYDSLRPILAAIAFRDLEKTLLDVKTTCLY